MKTKKGKKKSSPLFISFPTSISNFPPSLSQFSFFSSKLSPLFPFFLASFFPIRQQKFPGHKFRGGALCPPVTPLVYIHSQFFISISCSFFLTGTCFVVSFWSISNEVTVSSVNSHYNSPQNAIMNRVQYVFFFCLFCFAFCFCFSVFCLFVCLLVCL